MWLSLLFIFTKLTHIISYVTNLEKEHTFGLLKLSVAFMETSVINELNIHGSGCCHKKPCLFLLHQSIVVVTIEICKEAVIYFYRPLFLWETTTLDGFYVRFSALSLRCSKFLRNPNSRLLCSYLARLTRLMVFTSLLISNGCISIYAPIIQKMTMKKTKSRRKVT